MTQQSMPSPIQVAEAAIAQAKKVMAGVKPNQLSQPSPCGYWTAQGVMAHLVGSAEWLPTFFQDGIPPTPGVQAAQASMPAYESAAAKALQAAKAPGAMAKSASFGSMTMTGPQALMAFAMDTCIHSWDLAKATGQDTRLDPKLVEASYPVMQGLAQMGRQMGVLGPEVHVSASASTQDKLLAISGRKP